MTARRLVLLTVLGVLVAGAVGVFAVGGAPSKPDFTLAVSPSSQSVVAGSSVTYSVTISRQGGFATAVALSVSGLPAGAAASFAPATPVAGATTTMTLTTAGATPVGNRTLTLTGSGGGKTRTALFALSVQPAATPTFSLSVTPSAQTISQDDSTTFDVSVARLSGFTGAVSLSLAGLPKKATGAFAPSPIPAEGTSSVLTIASAPNSDVGTFALVVTATGGSPTVTRTATVTLNVEKKHVFSITGNVSQALYPGGTSALDLTLTNPNNFTIRVSPLTASVEEHTSNPPCSGTQNFTTSPLVGYVDVPGNATKTLTQLGVTPASLPQVTFLSTPANQDACKSVRITLQYSGTAVKP